MRALLAAALLVPAVALADAPTADTTADSAVASPPSELDAVRLFNTTEVFHLAPSDVRAEVRVQSDIPSAQPTLEVHAEVGLTSHFQLSLSEDLTSSSGSIQPSATPIALRYSLGSEAGGVPGNPAIEAEVVPRPDAPARGGLRLLASSVLVPHLVVAANAYLEQNLNRETSAGVDGAMGLTGGASYGLLGNHLRLGAEAQVGSAENGTQTYTVVIAAGPNMVAAAGPCAATLTALGDLARRQVGFEPMATLGCTF